ncbi:phosphomevalonate kinase [Nocardia goodfellowii]|uniref:phosphomevalonate kinase n=1 Tax=Nocardia goodfellowii TaxID=882446 RepID=A0ABS4QIM3_9NOCA|nr:phosphomevalonate kinase [Nocardia goodfellowii]MBP2191557.1 phosphomevalonate kinase [Nocardia goodfellowii]
MIAFRAPGKLFIAGEYAVLDPGGAAVLVAVDRYVTATVTEPRTETVSTPNVDGHSDIRCERIDGRAITPRPQRPGFDYVLAAVAAVERLAIEYGRQPQPFELTTRGRGFADPAGRKLGLGSSAAATVATIGALQAFYGLGLGLVQRFKLALLATLMVNPQTSGGDLAASTWGGWVHYRSPDRRWINAFAARNGSAATVHTPWPGLAVRQLDQPNSVDLLVGSTGRPASTPTLTRLFHRGARPPAADRAFVTASNACVQRLVTAIDSDDVAVIQVEIRQARTLLADLDALSGLGILTDRLTALCAAAEAAGAAAKPSGAGGGDCGIAIACRDRPEIAVEVDQRWRGAGILPLPLHVPASEGIGI